MKQPTLELRIDRLIVEGIAPSDAGMLRCVIERELTQRLAAQADNGPMLPRDIRHVDAGTTAVPSSAGPQRLGAAIAERVAGGLKR